MGDKGIFMTGLFSGYRIARIAVLSVSLSLGWPLVGQSDPGANEAATSALSSLRDERPEITEAIARWQNAADGKSYFSKDKDDYRHSLDKLLDEALASLGLDDGRRTRDAILKLDAQIKEFDEKLADLEVERLSSNLPRKDQLTGIESYNPLTRTAEKLEAEIDVLNERRSDAESKRLALVDAFRAHVSDSYRQDLDVRQAEALLYQANGVDLVQTAETVRVLTAIERKLGESLRGTSRENIALIRQYYEISVITRLLIQRLNERHLANYDEIYFPALDALRARQAKEMKAVERTAAGASNEAQRTVMKANLKRQAELDKALTAYRGILKAGQEKTRKLLARSRQESDVALSTLATYNLTADISDLGAKHFRELSEMASLSAPDLMPLNDDKLFNQLIELSKEMPAV